MEHVHRYRDVIARRLTALEDERDKSPIMWRAIESWAAFFLDKADKLEADIKSGESIRRQDKYRASLEREDEEKEALRRALK